ncbi:RHS repeat domain-containing protein [Microbulbifer sp. 2201CG32-9]|uniref:hypothetical protein n=1 Tax=Microbulbifer sp. 2201CG32-9 TaxID=3232309 RepID=UPI00345BEF53
MLRFLCCWCLLVGILSSLMACGGGGSDGTTNGDDGGVQTGVLTEVVVAGLPYRTETQSGVTGSGGEFSFREDETITFFIGDIPIGFAVPARERLRLRDLFPQLRLYRVFNDLKFLFAQIPSWPELRAFNRFHNTLFLLEAFDRDSDLGNGVVLDAGVPELLDGVQMDLGIDIFVFSRHFPPLIYFANRADELGLVDSAAVRNTGMVLDSYYRSVGLVSGFYLPVGETLDFLTAPLLDEIIDYKYDDPGNLIEILRDYDRDPLTAIAELATFDEFGNILSLTLEAEALRVDDELARFDYDSAGNLIEIRRDTNGDGNFDLIQTRDYVFGDLAYEIRVTETRDASSDHRIQFTLFYQLDSAGRLTELRRDRELLASFDYFAGGVLKTERLFVAGKAAPVRVREFDQLAQLVLLGFDTAELGTGQWQFFYNQRGQIVRQRFRGTTPDHIPLRLLVEREYGLGRELLLLTVDFGEDGNIDRSREFVYDNDIQLVREVWFDHVGSQKTAVFEVTYQYDAAGQVLVKTRSDLRPDTPLLATGARVAFIYGYDERGNLLSVERDNRMDGGVDFEQTFILSRINWRAALLWIQRPSVYSRQPFETLPPKSDLLRSLDEFVRLQRVEDHLVDIDLLVTLEEDLRLFRALEGVEAISINCGNPFRLEFLTQARALLSDLEPLEPVTTLVLWSITRDGVLVIVDEEQEFRFQIRLFTNPVLLPGQPQVEFVFELRPLDVYPPPYGCTFRGRLTRDVADDPVGFPLPGSGNPQGR